MTRESLVIVGAGSVVFTPGLLRQLAGSRRFDTYDVRLVDLDQEAAETMATLGRRIAQAHGSGLRVEAVADRRAAFEDATAVVTTIAVGSSSAWRRDLEISARHGVLQTVGDTVGPGGVLRALRQVPQLLAIAEDLAAVAPQALLINYSNPMSVNVRAILKYTGIEAIGLCHGTLETKLELAGVLAVDPDELHVVFAGLNHLCWLLDLRHGGRDLYPRLRELVLADTQQAPGDGNRVHGAVTADLLRAFGRYPSPGDRHVCEFLAGYLHQEQDGRLAWGLQSGLDRTNHRIDDRSDIWDRLRDQAAGRAPLDVSGNQESERLAAILEARFGNHDAVEMAVNLRNAGSVSNLPEDAVVEVPAVVGPAGIRGVSVGALPDAIAALLGSRVLQQELTVDAAVRGDWDLAVQALTLDPLVPSVAAARGILEDAAADDAGLGRVTAPAGSTA